MPRILVVDDDVSLARVIQTALLSLGQVECSHSVKAALQQVHDFRPHLLIVDYRLDRQNGKELIEELRKVSPVSKSILISAHAEKHMAIEAIDLGVSALLEKPFTLEKLRNKVIPILSEFNEPAECILLIRERKIKIGKEEISLTGIEMKIFSSLWENRNHVIFREELNQLIWPNMKVSDNTLDTHLGNLKKKVPLLTSKIKVVRGSGYLLEWEI